MNMKKLLLSAVALIALSGSVVAGIWNNSYPIVGGAAYCASTGNNGVCNTTIAAGPTAVTGNETIPGDTNLSGGQNPQTVILSMRSLNAAPVTYTACAAAACGTVTVGNNAGGVLLSYSTTIDSATIVTPLSPMDGQRFSVAADHTITTLVVSANTGTTLAATTPTVLTASATAPQGYEFMYVLSTTKWYRIR